MTERALTKPSTIHLRFRLTDWTPGERDLFARDIEGVVHLMLTKNFATDEDKTAYEKADEIFYSYVDHEGSNVVYWLWKIAQNNLLEWMADCLQSRAKYRIRPHQNFTPLAMLQELLKDVRLYSHE